MGRAYATTKALARLPPAAVTFLCLLVMTRLMGQRMIGRLTLFDFIVAILIGTAAASPLSTAGASLVGAIDGAQITGCFNGTKITVTDPGWPNHDAGDGVQLDGLAGVMADSAGTCFDDFEVTEIAEP